MHTHTHTHTRYLWTRPQAKQQRRLWPAVRHFMMSRMYIRAIVDYFYFYNYHYIDKLIYFNLCKSSQSAAGLKALKPAANRRNLMCKSSCFRNPPNSDMDYRIFNVRTFLRGWIQPDRRSRIQANK